MKLIYTSIDTSLTKELVKEAQSYVKKGKKVFYIAPNSLSFEKEKTVLETLESHASFQIIVTRFVQLGRYLLTRSQQSPALISEQGLIMVFYRVLSQLSDKDLTVFGKIRTDYDFIQQLVDLYHEVKNANLDFTEIDGLEIPDKSLDFNLIFTRVDEVLLSLGYPLQSQLSYLNDKITMGAVDDILTNCVFIIDGFSRFSVEERSIIQQLETKSSAVVVGVYVSDKSLKMPYPTGNLYQASLDFIKGLKQDFSVEMVDKISSNPEKTVFSKVTDLLESSYDFTLTDKKIEDTKQIKLREVTSIREEIEEVARAIRKDLQDGYRYKDILVLLGDVESYHLQLGQIFDKFDIPFYYGKSESMSHHPLVHFVESLERIGRYNFRYEDVINLFKTGLYGQINQKDLDQFERYVKFAMINGKDQFSKAFDKGSKKNYSFETLNRMRETNIEPLIQLFKSRKQVGSNLLSKLMIFFESVKLTYNMSKFGEQDDLIETEKNEEVWKTFCEILEQVQLIFKDEKMTLADLLTLVKQAMLSAEYRVVPATVDVVGVKSYDLIEPHTTKIVYAIGMGRQNYPKITVNQSLITDDERLRINEHLLSHTGDKKTTYLDVLKTENIKKNHFTTLSLLNSASDKLVISYPKSTSGDTICSPYIVELLKLGLSLEQVIVDTKNLGHYKALLSQILSFYSYDTSEDWDGQDQNFWKVMGRYLAKKLEKESFKLPKISSHIETKTVAKDVIDRRFEDGIHLSTTALTQFYANQYLYFVKYVLGLKESDTLALDARIHGTYLHLIFERLMKADKSMALKELINHTIDEVNKDEAIKLVYSTNQEALFSQSILTDIARFTSQILLENDKVQADKEELAFNIELAQQVNVRGVIDRLDKLNDGSLGVVDYKSSKNTFDLAKFYNGLNSQLITYLNFLASEHSSIFGAMYFQMQEPKLDLTKEKSLENIPVTLRKQLTYKGIFLESAKDHLPENLYYLRDSVYSENELETLLAYNKWLYQNAAKQILSGHFAINPYSTDGKSVSAEQLKAMTGFEADKHFSQVRLLKKFPRKDKKAQVLSAMRDIDTERESEEEANV